MDAGGGTASSASTASTQSGTSSEENDDGDKEPITLARRKLATNAADKRNRNTARAEAAAADTPAPAPGAAAPLGQRQTQPAGGGGSGESDKGKQVKQACVFFARGRCRYGGRCRFSHDAVEETPAPEGGEGRGSHDGGGGGSAGKVEKVLRHHPDPLTINQLSHQWCGETLGWGQAIDNRREGFGYKKATMHGTTGP